MDRIGTTHPEITSGPDSSQRDQQSQTIAAAVSPDTIAAAGKAAAAHLSALSGGDH
ncbi:hypothetical protein [Streptomyces sp. NPDC048516]|uniref:hypothetical protein n=1 Tax=Streptomyces sp. NPDC048516 TaxID=3365565 RepID=UPI0037248380